MIANIRIQADGNSQSLCQLDLMKFGIEEIRQRMSKRGIKEDSLFVCGFSDWQIDTIMSLEEAYLLRKVILELYDGDDFLIQHMLSHHQSPMSIMTHYLTRQLLDPRSPHAQVRRASKAARLCRLQDSVDRKSVV